MRKVRCDKIGIDAENLAYNTTMENLRAFLILPSLFFSRISEKAYFAG